MDPYDNLPATKFFDVVGEVVARIHNPELTSKAGKKYRLNYLVIKWTTGRRGEYVDYLKIKLLEGKKMADIRAGYIVKVPLMYRCSISTDKVEMKTREVGGALITEPNLWPEFTIPKNGEILIVNRDNNYEEKEQENKKFEQEMIPSGNEDDLPF